MKNSAYLGAGWINQVLVSLDTLALFEAITVDDLGLCIASDDKDGVPCSAVLQGSDLVAAHMYTPQLQVNSVCDKVT